MYPEIVMCLAHASKKCEVWRPHLRGVPIAVLPNFVKFYLFIFAYFENFHQSRVSDSVLKFGVLVWRGSLHFGTPNFVKFYLIFISAHIENIINPAYVVKFWVLASLFEEDSLFLVPNFFKFYLFFIFAYPENFMCLAWGVKKLEF